MGSNPIAASIFPYPPDDGTGRHAVYRRVHFEICGICNGRCPWCATGRRVEKSGTVLPVETFARAIDALLDREVIAPDACVHLYSWGEPLLHPELARILGFLRDTELHCAISTNASRAVLFDEPRLLEHLDRLSFSMPGFSQASYDRIHGFRFDTVTDNITRLVESCRQSGFTGIAEILFHLYRFNLDEVAPAAAFACSLDMHFLPFAAFLAGYDLMKGYLTGSMPDVEMKRASAELLLSDVAERAKAAPRDYVCPQYDILSVDERCNVLTCCALQSSHACYSVGSLFDLSADEIDRRRRRQPVCRECLDLGIPWLFHNPVGLDEARARYR